MFKRVELYVFWIEPNTNWNHFFSEMYLSVQESTIHKIICNNRSAIKLLSQHTAISLILRMSYCNCHCNVFHESKHLILRHVHHNIIPHLDWIGYLEVFMETNNRQFVLNIIIYRAGKCRVLLAWHFIDGLSTRAGYWQIDSHEHVSENSTLDCHQWNKCQ